MVQVQQKKIVGWDTSGCAGVSWQFPYACAVLFLLKEGNQTFMTSFSDITTLAHAFGRGYISKACMSLWAVIWVFGTEHFSQLLGGH